MHSRGVFFVTKSDVCIWNITCNIARWARSLNLGPKLVRTALGDKYETSATAHMHRAPAALITWYLVLLFHLSIHRYIQIPSPSVDFPLVVQNERPT